MLLISSPLTRDIGYFVKCGWFLSPALNRAPFFFFFFTSIILRSFMGNTQHDSWYLPVLITLGCVRGKIKMIDQKPPANSQVHAPSWKRIPQSQSSLQMSMSGIIPGSQKLWDSKYALFEATQFGDTLLRSNRELIQRELRRSNVLELVRSNRWYIVFQGSSWVSCANTRTRGLKMLKKLQRHGWPSSQDRNVCLGHRWLWGPK